MPLMIKKMEEFMRTRGHSPVKRTLELEWKLLCHRLLGEWWIAAQRQGCPQIQESN